MLTGSETPKFFYGRADYLGLAYRTVSEYLEMDGRIEVLNSRFQVRRWVGEARGKAAA